MNLFNTGDTVFMLLCTAMVCLMTPGLAFFYGGLTRKKNLLVMMAQSFLSVGVTTLMWIFGGFGFVFGRDFGGIIGSPKDYFLLDNFDNLQHLLNDVKIPFLIFFAFQLMFCVITVPLMTGAFASRLTMDGYLVLLILWNLLIYFPVAHWVWGGGFLQQMNFRDFAGGAVIHTTAGFGSLATIIYLGHRQIDDKEKNQHSSIMSAAIGTGLLWFGWFGFNAGGALQASQQAVNSAVATFLALATAMVTWLIITKIYEGSYSFVDILTGSVAGLATITPASGFIEPVKALPIGVIAGIVCYASVKFKNKHQWDDALDVWGVHGMGGFVGTILIGIFAANSSLLSGDGFKPLAVQIFGVVLIAVYSYLVTRLILEVTNKFIRIKTTAKEQEEGLDLVFFAKKED